MLHFVVKRILEGFISFMFIMILMFWLIKHIPGSYEELSQGLEPHQTNVKSSSSQAFPVFYISICPSHIPKSYFYLNDQEKEFAQKLINHNIDAAYAHVLYHILDSLHTTEVLKGQGVMEGLDVAIEQLGQKPTIELPSYPSSLESYFTILRSATKQPKSATRIPTVYWFGANNMFHLHLATLFSGSLGTSKVDNQSVGKKIIQSLRWTAVIQSIAIFLTVILAISIANMRQLKSKYILFTQTIDWALTALYVVPSFWLASMAIVFFTNDEYFNWFPSSGMMNLDQTQSVLFLFFTKMQYFLLPLIVIVLSAIPFVYRQYLSQLKDEMDKDYVKRLLSSGHSVKAILFGPAMKNSLFPIVNWIATMIPGILAGSMVIESVFNIPGMGRLLFQSIHSRDWPVVQGVLIFTALITITSYLVADVVYRLIDPRLKSVPS